MVVVVGSGGMIVMIVLNIPKSTGVVLPTVCIMVQERLYPLHELQTVKEYAQVFFNTLQSAYTLLTYNCNI